MKRLFMKTTNPPGKDLITKIASRIIVKHISTGVEEMWLSGRVLAYHTGGPVFNPQHHKIKFTIK